MSQAIFLLARFGDRERVDRRLNRLRELAAQNQSSASLPSILTAHGELARVLYRIDGSKVTRISGPEGREGE